MTLSDIKTALLAVTDQVYHFEATGAEGAYIVWAEDGQGDAVWANGAMQTQALSGTIDYFTKDEGDEAIAEIQAALISAGIAFGLNSIQYEPDTGYIHYEWTWEVA